MSKLVQKCPSLSNKNLFLDFNKRKNLFLDFNKIKKSIIRLFVFVDIFLLLKSQNRKNLKIDFYWTSLDTFGQAWTFLLDSNLWWLSFYSTLKYLAV